MQIFVILFYLFLIILEYICITYNLTVYGQNVLKLFETKNVLTLIKAADILKVPLSTLIYGNQSIDGHTIDGFIDVDGKIFRVRSKKDLENILYAL